jgi:hypothetical protein
MSKQAKSKSVSLNIDELKNFLTHIISNNRHLQSTNKTPVSVEVVGDSGIGKTSAIIQLAKELNLHFVKLNLAQIEELGDLVGFPIRQFEVCNIKNNENCIWIDEHATEEYLKRGYSFTGNNRMSYCPPEWISGKQKGGILLLDDWNRADIRFIQAVMELIDRQQYISWKLPQDWHIILTSNPDNGEYLVNSIDNAQRTRFITANLKFDIECWGRWAEQNQLDSRCINFLLMHPELVTTDINSRSISMFFNSISSLPSFEASLALIQMIGEGSVGDEFSSLFTMFINNKLDKIISPKDILFHNSEEYVLNTLKGVIGKGNAYRADIASTIATRIVNYSLFFSKENKVEKPTIDRISKLITEDIFANDLKYQIVKQIYNGNPNEFKLITLNKELMKFVIK